MALTQTEAVALISAGSVVLGAAVTGLLTYRITTRQVTAARNLAREERVQSRRAEAYLELFDHVARLNTWIEFVMAIDQRGSSSDIGQEPAIVGEERWYPMISLARAFGSRDVLSAFARLHMTAQAISAGLRRHPPPTTPAQAQGTAYRDHAESRQRRDFCWDALVLIYTVQPMMANELQGEIHPLPTVEDVRTGVADAEAAREVWTAPAEYN
jgi:hypothetical protein